MSFVRDDHRTCVCSFPEYERSLLGTKQRSVPIKIQGTHILVEKSVYLALSRTALNALDGMVDKPHKRAGVKCPIYLSSFLFLNLLVTHVCKCTLIVSKVLHKWKGFLSLS